MMRWRIVWIILSRKHRCSFLHKVLNRRCHMIGRMFSHKRRKRWRMCPLSFGLFGRWWSTLLVGVVCAHQEISVHSSCTWWSGPESSCYSTNVQLSYFLRNNTRKILGQWRDGTSEGRLIFAFGVQRKRCQLVRGLLKLWTARSIDLMLEPKQVKMMRI